MGETGCHGDGGEPPLVDAGFDGGLHRQPVGEAGGLQGVGGLVQDEHLLRESADERRRSGLACESAQLLHEVTGCVRWKETELFAQSQTNGQGVEVGCYDSDGLALEGSDDTHARRTTSAGNEHNPAHGVLPSPAAALSSGGEGNSGRSTAEPWAWWMRSSRTGSPRIAVSQERNAAGS